MVVVYDHGRALAELIVTYKVGRASECPLIVVCKRSHVAVHVPRVSPQIRSTPFWSLLLDLIPRARHHGRRHLTRRRRDGGIMSNA